MDWTDEGYVLAARRHGESAAIVQLLTRRHGRHAGLVHGGAGAKARGMLQPGNRLRATWRGRLAEHLGNYRCEPIESNAAAVIEHAAKLATLSAACAVAESALPEREPHETTFDGFAFLMDSFAGDIWAAVYVLWERNLLAELGYGLDLTNCAATGVTENLIYISPKTGRAASAEAGAPYKDRLFRLPPFLRTDAVGDATPVDVRDGLIVTGHFLDVHIYRPHDQSLPPARARLVDYLTAQRIRGESA